MKLIRTGKAAVAIAAALGTLCLSQFSAKGVGITVDQIIFPPDIVNPGMLSGTVDMTYSGNVLTITLKNTSLNGAGSGASILLTGIGFYLPGTLAISTGSANMGSSTAVGFVKPGDGDVSEEWGYDNAALDSGAIQAQQAPTGGQLAADTVVSSMESQTTSQFQAGSIAAPVNLDGPDFGLISTSELDALGSGVEGIKDTVVITLNLSGTFGGDLLGTINSNWVVLSFGSPGDGPGQQVPDAGSTLLLLGTVLAAFGIVRRQVAK